MAFTLADAVVYFKGDDTQLKKDTDGAEATTTSFVSKATNLLGGALVGGFVAAGAAAVGLGAAALGVQGDFDAALDAITVKTGATGAELEGMGESVRALKTSSAGLGLDFEQIGNVLGTVSTRTGATGDTLETLTGQILNFSRLTGGDAVTNTELLSRTMGDWGVSAENAGGLLDQLYGAQQTFGIGTEDLSSKLVAFGAPLRQMGFSLEESIALFGKWEQEGVNTELALGSLRVAAGKFAAENIPLRQGLEDVMTSIKGASSSSEALNLAMETFGARAGPDMAAAIREGRFELNDAIKALQGTKGNLDAAAEGTLDFRDKWQIVMSKVTDAMLPLGEKLAELAEKLFPSIEAAIEFLIPIVSSLIDGLISLIDAFTGTQAQGEELTGFLGGIPDVLSGVVSAFTSVTGYLRDSFFGAMDQTGGKFDFIKERVDVIFPYIQTIIETVLGAIEGFWTAHGDAVTTVVTNTFDSITTAIATALDVILQAITLALQLITGDWAGAAETLQSITDTLWEGISDIFSNQLDSIRTLIGDFDLAGAGRAIVESLQDGISDRWGELVDWFRDKVQGLRDLLPFSEPKDPTSPLRNLSQAGRGIVEQVQKGLNDFNFNGDFLRPIAAAAGGGGRGGVGGVNIVQNFYGPADETTVRRASEDGVLAALRARGR